MDSPKIDDILIKDEDFSDLLLLDFEKYPNGTQAGRKYNSLNDLEKNTKKGPYRNVESKVKHYIANLPAPGSGNTRRKTLKKHTSMPGYFEDCAISHGHSEASISSCLKLEQEFSDYKRQAVHTIGQLQEQINVSVAMISTANNENFELLDRIAHMQKEVQDLKQHTPVSDIGIIGGVVPGFVKKIWTPRKAPPKVKNRLPSDDTAGSFLGQPLPTDVAAITPATIDCTPETTTIRGKRNLSFNSTGGDVTRRSGGTDSGINTSEENEIQIQVEDVVEPTKMPAKRKKIKRFLDSLVCCIPTARQVNKISYKKM